MVVYEGLGPELTVTFSREEIEHILRKEIRKNHHRKGASSQDRTILQCFKKDNITLDFTLEEEGGLKVMLKNEGGRNR